MKFGRNLSRNQVPEWAASYINYKDLKKLVKAAAETAKHGGKVDLAEFFFALDRNLEDVDSFYNKRFAEACRRLRLLHDRYGRTPDVVAHLDQDEVEELMGALLELRSQLRNLQWFGEINRRGFVKITKKLDKKVPDTATQHRYIATKVDTKPFAKDNIIVRHLAEINKWLSALGDAKTFDDSMSDRSARSLGRASAKAMLTLPSATLDKLDQAIRTDDVDLLKAGLEEGNLMNLSSSSSDLPSQSMRLNLLQRSISARAKASIGYLLPSVQSLDEPDDINERNCIHRLVIHIGRTKTSSATDEEMAPYAFSNGGPQYAAHYLTPAASPQQGPRFSPLRESRLLDETDEAVQILSYLLEKLGPEQRAALSAQDSFGRLPLHYGAQFGFVVVCRIIMAKMQQWGQFDVSGGIDAPEWQDKEGNAPLHLSVIGGHPLTTRALLDAESWQGPIRRRAELRKGVSKSSAVLAIAAKSNFKQVVKMLVDAGVDINWQDDTGETALHLAARFGHDECASLLIQGTADQKAGLELAEKSFAWTPLHISAVDGHLPVARLLMEAGAEDKPDSSGWTAQEHAALRGHIPIARLLAEYANKQPAAPPLMTTTPPVAVVEDGRGVLPEVSSSLGDRRSNNNGNPRPAEPVRTYGHRYLRNQSLVLVSLGSMDLRKPTEAVKLDRVPLAEAHTTQLDTALSVVVTASGAQGERTVIDLPVHESISTEPMLFTTTDATNVKLLFDIVPTYSGNEKNKVGRGVALLSSIRPPVGAKRMNLQGDLSVPIMAANLEVIGTVHFTVSVITPFSHPNMEVTSEQTYWKKMESTMVIGHRGLGKNVTPSRSLQLGENTLPSFIAAANLGAQYVEFDVQLTKDHIPVIYHDFLVSETGIDAPVHALTLEQFLHINPDSQRRHQNRDDNDNDDDDDDDDDGGGGGGGGGPPPPDREKGPATKQQQAGRNSPSGGGGGGGGGWRRRQQRSHSVGNVQMAERAAMEERMKHTRDFKAKGFKANSRGNFIQAPFATLEDLFRRLPQSIGFNIEMKYPMLHESEEHEMDTYAVELNSFCDTVLAKVYDMAGDRPVIFSSFNPDICLCLSFKQPNYPIMFLTDAGVSNVGDVRASSLQEAIRFASRWNLLGIVSTAEPFTNSPRLVRVVKQNGLVCVSYGALNNDPLMVQRQVKEGIDAVIVDSVLAIRKGLTKDQGATETGETTPVVVSNRALEAVSGSSLPVL